MLIRQLIILINWRLKACISAQINGFYGERFEVGRYLR
jgi:hypothetical protein